MTERRRVRAKDGAAPAREAGFTLLEVLVALTILGLSVAVIFGILSRTLDVGRSDAREMAARNLAQAVLTDAESSPPASDRAGMGPAGLQWRLHVSPLSQSEDAARGPHAVRLAVTVHWTIDNKGQSLTLATLALAPGESGS